jgi:GTP pyrophosphokinase
MNIRKKALNFATEAHKGQKRKDGKDYITHPIAVAEIALGNKEFDLHPSYMDDLYVLAILHDTVEDTDVSLDDIKREFGDYIAEGIEVLSKIGGENYFNFIKRVGDHYDVLPMIVKVADLRHNMSDLNEGSMKDKYRFAEHYLARIINGARW